jgi:ParB family chromosome partitioning protein
VQELLRERKLDMGHARALLALPALAQIELAREAVAKRLSVREVESRVAAAQSRAPRARSRPDRDVARLEEEVSQRLGTTVRIRQAGKKGAGRLIVHYANLGHLEALLAKLR